MYIAAVNAIDVRIDVGTPPQTSTFATTAIWIALSRYYFVEAMRTNSALQNSSDC